MNLNHNSSNNVVFMISHVMNTDMADARSIQKQATQVSNDTCGGGGIMRLKWIDVKF